MATVDRYALADGSTKWRVRYRKPDGGTSMKRGFNTKREALAWEASNTVSIASGSYVAPSAGRATFAQVASDRLAGKVNLKDKTRAGYRHSLDSRVLPQWGKRAMSAITHAEVQRWVASMSTSGLAPNSVRIHFNVAHAVLKYAVKIKAISTNPAEDVNLPRGTKAKRGYLTHAQVDALSHAAGDIAGVGGDIVLLLAYTGLRWGELCALRVSSIDFDRRRLDVSRSVARVDGRVVYSTPKTGETRSVPFPAFLTQVLQQHSGDKSTPDDLLLCSSSGTPLSGHNFRSRVFRPAVEACQRDDPSFPGITVHDLRHTAASLAISAGANVKAIQRMLGHASAAMTLDVYADLFDDDLDSVADAMERARNVR